ARGARPARRRAARGARRLGGGCAKPQCARRNTPCPGRGPGAYVRDSLTVPGYWTQRPIGAWPAGDVGACLSTWAVIIRRPIRIVPRPLSSHISPATQLPTTEREHWRALHGAR